MPRLATTELREKLSDTLSRVAFAGERIILERHGKDVAALVSVQDLELLEALEDRMDLEAAREALAEPGTIPWEAVKERLGL